LAAATVIEEREGVLVAGGATDGEKPINNALRRPLSQRKRRS